MYRRDFIKYTVMSLLIPGIRGDNINLDQETPNTPVEPLKNGTDMWLPELKKGTLTILAGRPSMGKHDFALRTGLYNLLKKKKNVAFLQPYPSHETVEWTFKPDAENPLDLDSYTKKIHYTSKDEYFRNKMIAYITGIPYIHVSSCFGKFCAHNLKAIKDTVELLNPNTIKANNTRIDSAKSLRKWIHKNSQSPIDLVILDNFIEYNHSINAIIEISEIKKIAQEFNVPLLCTYPLGRYIDERNDYHPLITDIDSTARDNADTIITLYRDEVYNPDSIYKGAIETHVIPINEGIDGYAISKYSPL